MLHNGDCYLKLKCLCMKIDDGTWDKEKIPTILQIRSSKQFFNIKKETKSNLLEIFVNNSLVHHNRIIIL